MKKITLFAGILLLMFAALAGAQESDPKGSKDHPLLSRIPGYMISEQTNIDFDSYTSPYLEKENVWEGKETKTNYHAQEGTKEMGQIRGQYTYLYIHTPS